MPYMTCDRRAVFAIPPQKWEHGPQEWLWDWLPIFHLPQSISSSQLGRWKGLGEETERICMRMNFNRGENSTKVISGPHVTAFLENLSREPNVLLFQKGAGDSNLIGK